MVGMGFFNISFINFMAMDTNSNGDYICNIFITKMKTQLAICIRTFSGIFKGRQYNRLEFLRKSLESIFVNTSLPYKLFIIDDCSTNQEHLDYIRSFANYDNIQIIEKGDQRGRQHSFALQLYHGYKSNCPYIKIADDDFVYSPGWDIILIKAYENLKKYWKRKPIGLITGFNREGQYKEIYDINDIQYARKTHWIGGNWLMSRDVLKKGGWDNLTPTKNFPKQWTSPWIDDGSYQMDLSNKFGFEHAFIYLQYPSLTDHIGTIGVHASPKNYARGAK